MTSKQLTMGDLARRALSRGHQRDAIRVGDMAVSYASLSERAHSLARSLAGKGLGPGDPVVLLLKNGLDYVVADIAIMLSGACKVPLNDMLSADDVAFMIEHSGARCIIAHSSFTPLLNKVPNHILEGVGVRIALEDGFPVPKGFSAPEASEAPLQAAGPDDIAMIIYTGGTTGKPKGVVHKQAAMATNLLAHLVHLDIGADDHLLITTPLPHSAQLFAFSGLMAGAVVSVETNFEVDRVCGLIENRKITWTFMVPTMIYRLLDFPGFEDADTTSLRTLVYGAAPITPARLQEGISRLGPIFLQFYGQSEVPNLISALSKTDHLSPELHESCGQAVLSSEIEIWDDDNNSVDPGNIGEVVVRAPYSLSGYHKDPEKTGEIYMGPFVRTGDVGYLDESGFLFLVDRAKDMIITGGMNVYSKEVENAVQSVPGVSDVAVVGLPDDDWGEAVTAFVVGRTSLETVVHHCQDLLAKYKIPKRVELIDAIPLTQYGKPDKKALRTRAII